jgi:hypothetical protein
MIMPDDDEHLGPYERPSYLRAVSEPLPFSGRWVAAKIVGWVRWLDWRRRDSGPDIDLVQSQCID